MRTSKILFIFVVFLLMINSVYANIFATMAMNEGLKFVDPTIAKSVSEIVSKYKCGMDITTCVTGKITGEIQSKVYGAVFQEIQKISPEAMNAITKYEEIKGYVNKGAVILKELQINEKGNIENGKIEFNKEKGYIGKDFGFENNEDVAAKNVDVEFSSEYNKITFNKESSLNIKQNGEETTFENIKPSDEKLKTTAYVKTNKKGEITEADFYTNENGGVYVIGNEKITAPPNSRIIYKNRVAKITIPEGGILKEPPTSPDKTKSGYFVEVEGKNVILPEGYKLESGKITYIDNIPFVKKVDSATINGFYIKPVNIPAVRLKFSSKSPSVEDIIKTTESGSYVGFYKDNKLEITGDGYYVKFNGKKYTSNNIQESPYSTINLKNSKNKNYFQKGDEGDDVKKIQEFLKSQGYKIEADSKYSPSTDTAVKQWQKKNGLAADGKFGPRSLNNAIGKDTPGRSYGDSITITPERGTVVLSKTKELLFDAKGNSKISFGSNTLKIKDGKVSRELVYQTLAGKKVNGKLTLRDNYGKSLSEINLNDVGEVAKGLKTKTLEGVSNQIGDTINYGAEKLGIFVKGGRPISVEFFSHYLARSGTPLVLTDDEIPKSWKDIMIKTAKKSNCEKGCLIRSYDIVGLEDMETSIGNAMLYTKKVEGKIVYTLKDRYDFDQMKVRFGIDGSINDKTINKLNKVGSIIQTENPSLATTPWSKYRSTPSFIERSGTEEPIWEIGQTKEGKKFFWVGHKVAEHAGEPFDVLLMFSS